MKKLLFILFMIGSIIRYMEGTTYPQYIPATKSDIELSEYITTFKGKSHPNYIKIAQSVNKYSQAENIDPRLVLAVLMTESSFNQNSVSSTADYGIGQINPKVWEKEFPRLGREDLNTHKLMTDQDYAIKRTVEILSILKDQHSRTDSQWYARYHSNTFHHKTRYSAQIQKYMNKMNQSSIIASN